MKNLKKVLAFTLALAMVLSTMTTTFAANETVDKLSNLGLLLNTSEQEVNAELTRSVGLAMVLKTLGYTQEDSNAKAAENTFIDMGTAEWAKGFAVIGEELKITNGISVEPKMFAPAQKLDKKAFVTFMLRALGYDTNQAWEKAATLAQEAKLVDTQTLEDANFTKGEAAMIMYNALKATVQEDAQKRSLAQKLVDEGKLNKEVAVENGVLEGAAAKLEVMSVTASNLKEVTVMFNTKVEKATAEKTANYKLKGKAVSEAVLQEDGKTVVVTVEGSLANKKETKLTVTGVKTAEGVAIEKTEVMFVPFDDTYPKVEKITFTGPKNLAIQFSEPIKVQNSNQAVVTLKSENRRYSAKVDKVEGNMAYVTAYTSFKNGAEYLVAIGDPNSNNKYFYDYANYPNTYYEETLTYEKDTTAPEAEVKSANQKVVKVAFSKPVTGVTKKHFFHSFASYTAKEVYTSAKMDTKVNPTDKVSEVYVVFYSAEAPTSDNRALPAGDVTLTILGKADNKTEIKDAWGNKLATTSVALTIVADREAPEVVSVEVTGERTVKVTFNEEISNLTNATYALLDKNGSVARTNAQISKDTAANKKSVTLGFGKSYAGKTMVLSIKGIKDDSLYQNMMGDYSSEVEFTDKVWEGIESVEYKKEGNDYFLYVTYKEGMGESATNNKNYKIQIGSNTPINLQGEGDFYEGRNSIVRFALTSSDDDAKATDVKTLTGMKNGENVTPGAKLLVSQEVKDAAGNTPDEFQVVANIIDLNSEPLTNGIKSATATAVDRIEVKFNQEMATIDGSEFYVMYNNQATANDNKYEIGGYNVVDNKTLELFLTARDKKSGESVDKTLFGTDVADHEVKVYFNSGENTKDIFGRKLSSNDKVRVADKMAPAVAKLIVAADSGNATDLANAFSTNNFKLNEGAANANAKYDNQPAVMGYKLGLSEYVVKIAYTEKINNSSVSTTTYSVNNSTYRVKSAASNNTNIVTVVLEKANSSAFSTDDIATLSGLSITQEANVLDMNNNSYAGPGTVNIFQVEKDTTQTGLDGVVKLTGAKNSAVIEFTFHVNVLDSDTDGFKKLTANDFKLSKGEATDDSISINNVTFSGNILKVGLSGEFSSQANAGKYTIEFKNNAVVRAKDGEHPVILVPGDTVYTLDASALTGF